jgi:Sulfite oxidase and related enzymes
MQRYDLLNEHIYDRERADEFIWKQTKTLGLSRRQFIQLLAAGAGAAATVNLLPFPHKALAAEADQAIIKPAPPELFLQSGSNLEMRWEAMYNRGYLVPNELFFVRNNSPAVPRLDPATWRLQVGGSGVLRPRSFRYDEILAMPSISVIRALECAGNGRNFFQVSHGKKIAGTPWNLGGIGVAEWTGVPCEKC